MALSRWDPFYSFPMFPSVDRTFNRARRMATLTNAPSALPLDVYEDHDGLVVKAHLPGADPKDVTVNLERGVLTIEAHVGSETADEDKDRRWHAREVWHGDVRRTITLPVTVDADKATATFDNGVLTLNIPKAETAKPRQIPVTVNA